MGLSMKKMLLLAKVEVTPGVDSTPTAGANAILVRATTPQPIVADQVDRNLIRPFKGNSGSLTAGVHSRMQFEVELAGAGTAGTAPKWGPLLQACGFSETLSVGVSAVYQVVSSGEPTLTLYGFLDGIRFKMTHCKGTVRFTLDAKGIPIMAFDFLGVYNPVTDVALPTGVDYSGFLQPLTVGKVNTPIFSIHGHSGCLSALGIDVGNQLVFRELVNCAKPHSSDRKATGTAVFELTTVATKNWAEQLRLSVEDALTITHGTVPGNTVQIDLPKIQFTGLDLQNQDEVAMLSSQFAINPTIAGNDEITVTVM